MNFPMGRVSRFDTFLEDRAKPETEAVLYISTINPANLFPQSKHCAKRTIFKETVHWSCGPRQTEVACARDTENQLPRYPQRQKFVFCVFNPMAANNQHCPFALEGTYSSLSDNRL